MERADTRSLPDQATYRGRHLPSDGRFGYGTGMRYVKCPCGWKLVNVPDTRRGRKKAAQAHQTHLVAIRALREAAGL